MAISANPTKTLTIEKNWVREVNRRWSEFKKSTIGRLTEMNDAAIASSLVNKTKPFEMSQEQIRIYMAYLQEEIQRLLIVAEEAPNWQAKYQLQAYERGLESTRQSLRSQGAELALTQSEILAAQGLSLEIAGTASVLGAASTYPIHSDALEFLYTRSYESLKGWTDAMARETRQILVEGLAQGKGITEITQDIVKRQDVSRSRAKVIAQTETIQAYQIATANETERASEELGEEILLRWLTRRDNKVRHLHAIWHGTVATDERTRWRMQQSPWNCRCAISPVITEANTPAKDKVFSEERKQLMALESKKK